MVTRIGILCFLLSVAVAGSGCRSLDLGRVYAGIEPPTATPRPAFTPRPADTPWPTYTPSPIPTPVTMGMPGLISATANVRLGPGTSYPIIAKLNKETKVNVRGRDANNQWLALVPPPNGWVLAALVTLNGDANALPVLEAPPTLVPTPTVAPSLTPQPTATPQTYVDFRADATLIPAGGCTTLRWDVEGVLGVYLDGRGQPGHGALHVCTHTARTFVLHIVPRTGAAFNRSVTVAVFNVPTPAP